MRLFSEQKIDVVLVVLVEPNDAFVSCPMSNLVVGGSKTLADMTARYDTLASKHGVRVVKDMVASIDPVKKIAVLASGPTIAYDKLVLSPGVELMFDNVQGLRAAQNAGMILQAWKAGPETVALRRQLEAMPDGGTFAITIPLAPYRCPPGPYERACQVASYFKTAKPKSKVLILDANPDVTSKPALFKKAWAEQYAGMVEYRNQHNATAVDARTNTVKFEIQDDVKADVLNVLPPMRAGAIAVQTGLANSNARWCNVNYQTFESTAAKDIHVLGDSIQIAPAMPKSGHMANSQARRGRSHRRRTLRLGDQCTADADQHLLQLHRREERHPRRQRARVRGRGEDVQDRGGIGWREHGAERAGGRLRVELGADDLGGCVGVMSALRLGGAQPRIRVA